MSKLPALSKRRLVFIAALSAVFGTAIAVLVRNSHQPQLTFVGTNGNGTVFIFGLTNYSSRPVFPYQRVEMKPPNGWVKHPEIKRERWSPQAEEPLNPGAGMTFDVWQPQSNCTWRVQLMFSSPPIGSFEKKRAKWAADLYRRRWPAVAEWLQPKPQGLILNGPEMPSR